jgi:hypothetical protein
MSVVSTPSRGRCPAITQLELANTTRRPPFAIAASWTFAVRSMFSRCAEAHDVPGHGSPARRITVSTSANCATRASFHSARSAAWISPSPRASTSSSLNVTPG